MDEHEESSKVIEEIRKHFEGLKVYFHSPIDVPVVGQTLDLESRARDQKRQFKHIHQGCTIAQLDLYTALYMRMLLTLESYLTLYESKSGLHLYAIARSVIELHGLARKVGEKLLEYRSGELSDWKSRGEGFFKYLTRARYGTRDPSLVKKLTDLGLPKSCLEPIHSRDIEKAVFSQAEFEADEEMYAKLCDYVHTNSQGYYVGSSGWFEAEYVSLQGGIVKLPEPGPVNRYEYPAIEAFEEAVSMTAPIVDRHLLGFKSAVERIPGSPYSKEEVRDRTGTQFGMEAVPLITPTSVQLERRETPKIGRNAPCPCGSGKKYKNCHLG